ncbi:MAG: DEAD/DEAH box helicase, partial [Inhella sp.]
MGAAQTGTGKTAAFSIPLLQRMLKHESSSMSPARHPVRAVVLAPTRELADQVAQNVLAYAKHTQLRVACVFGGVDIKPQAAQLKAGVEVLIATPGRLLDHIEAKNCALHQVEYVVLDEADRMLDIGFLPDLQRILSFLPKTRQTLLFSATFSPEIKRLASSYLQNPELVEVARPNATATNVQQRFFAVGDDSKRALLKHLWREQGSKQAIVFMNSKLGAARLTRALEREGLKASALHGDKSQDERLKTLAAFKAGEVDLLIATDVAGRGLDIAELPLVFNFDVPFNAEDYVHRIGRTGRAGASGMAITFISPSDARLVGDIEKLIKRKLDTEALPALDDERPRREPRADFREPREPRTEFRRGDDEAAPRAPRQLPRPSADPFFDKPYEEREPSEAPAWEQAAAAAKKPIGPARYIKPKRQTAALFAPKRKDEAQDASQEKIAG